MFSMNCLVKIVGHSTCVDSCPADLLDKSANKDRRSKKGRSVLSFPDRSNMLGNTNLVRFESTSPSMMFYIISSLDETAPLVNTHAFCLRILRTVLRILKACTACWATLAETTSFPGLI